MFHTLEKEKQDRWPEAYNNPVHSAAGFAPSNLMFGRTVRIPLDLGLGLVVDQQKWDLRAWVQDHYKKLKWAYAVGTSKMDHAAEIMKQTYDALG